LYENPKLYKQEGIMSEKLMILTLALAFAGCAGPMRSVSDYSYKTPPPSRDVLPDLDERLIVSSADLQIKTERSDSLHNQVMDISIKYGGYVLSSSNEITTIRLSMAAMYCHQVTRSRPSGFQPYRSKRRWTI
jgi:hypothetical protein